MKVIVVFESLWGSTAAVAQAIAEWIGPDARAMSTAEATLEVVAGADPHYRWRDTGHPI